MLFGHSPSLRFGFRALAGLLLVIGLSFTPVAQANSAPPPELTWFEFEDVPGRVEAVQILVCDTAACESADLHLATGRCTVSGCLEPAIEPTRQFTCHDDTCLMIDGWPVGEPGGQSWLRLLVQSQDRLWESNVVEAPFMDIGDRQRFSGQFSDEGLVIQPVEPAYGEQALSLFLQGLALTLVTEAGIMALVLRRLGQWPALWQRTFVSFGLMHVVTYPMVWTLTSGLQPFSFAGDRVFALIWVAIALIYGLCFYFLRRVRLRWLVVSPVLILSALWLPSMVVLFLFSYGRSTPLTTGLSYGVAVAIAEIAVTVYEAIFLAMLSRGQLSLRTTSGLSLLMNGASWALGVWIFQ
ncbi:MAG: hypothetical protein HC812_19350 [Leptolyngbya sp. RL_3_1]|nr:hypothetical protein [Leptolyngbya sp. RL_3_1]